MNFLGLPLLIKVGLCAVLGLGLAYGGAYLVRGYKQVKQYNLRQDVIKSNKSNVKKPCAYSLTERCDD